MPASKKKSASKRRTVKGGASPPTQQQVPAQGSQSPIPDLPNYGQDEAALVDEQIKELETEEQEQPLLASQVAELKQLRIKHKQLMEEAHAEVQRAFKVIRQTNQALNAIIADGADTDETVLQGDVAAVQMNGQLLASEVGNLYSAADIARRHNNVLVTADNNLATAMKAKNASEMRMQEKLVRVNALTGVVAQQEAEEEAIQRRREAEYEQAEAAYQQQQRQEQAAYTAALYQQQGRR